MGDGTNSLSQSKWSATQWYNMCVIYCYCDIKIVHSLVLLNTISRLISQAGQ